MPSFFHSSTSGSCPFSYSSFTSFFSSSSSVSSYSKCSSLVSSSFVSSSPCSLARPTQLGGLLCHLTITFHHGRSFKTFFLVQLELPFYVSSKSVSPSKAVFYYYSLTLFCFIRSFCQPFPSPSLCPAWLSPTPILTFYRISLHHIIYSVYTR